MRLRKKMPKEQIKLEENKMINKEIIEKKEGDYNTLISSIGTLLEEARKHVYSQINQILVKTYWDTEKSFGFLVCQKS